MNAINHEDTRTRALESFPQVEHIHELVANDSLNLEKAVVRILCCDGSHDFGLDWLTNPGVELKHEVGRKASLSLLVVDSPVLTCGVFGKTCQGGCEAAYEHVLSVFLLFPVKLGLVILQRAFVYLGSGQSHDC